MFYFRTFKRVLISPVWLYGELKLLSIVVACARALNFPFARVKMGEGQKNVGFLSHLFTILSFVTGNNLSLHNCPEWYMQVIRNAKIGRYFILLLKVQLIYQSLCFRFW